MGEHAVLARTRRPAGSTVGSYVSVDPTCTPGALSGSPGTLCVNTLVLRELAT
jgi:hypothetical protein